MVCSLPPLLLLLLLLFPPPCLPARTLKPRISAPDFMENVQPTSINESEGTEPAKWRVFEQFLDAGRGSNVTGMSELKKYFRSFGYFPATKAPAAGGGNFTDLFDEEFESAVNRYQTKLGLPVTGKLDSSTISQIMAPRCGVRDTSQFHGTKRYAFFPGMPRWSTQKSTLTYGFSPENSIDYLTPEEIHGAFRRAFSRWSSAIPVNFSETTDIQSADIKVGFYGGDHGDGEPFDGVLGVLAHAFSPRNGRFHLDTAERWAVDFESEKSRAAVDLESVATHEIGHILGLGHSSVKEAVMYPSLSPRSRKVNLKADDVQGVQYLYGRNPNFRMSSLFQSETSTDQRVHDSSESIKNNVFLGALIGLLILDLLNIVG